MHLEPVTAAELATFIRAATQGYAEQKRSMGGIPEAEAIDQAEQEAAELFPEGRLQPGHAVLKLVDDGVELGRIWLAPREEEPGLVFVYSLEIEPAQRGKGHGRTLMRLAHEWARSRGYRSISLHVFGGNEPAINLYRSLGYEVTDLSMRRSL